MSVACRWAGVRVLVCSALAIGLALMAGAQWSARRGTHVGAMLRRTGEHPVLAAQILEHSARLWPPRAEAAFERARLAAEQGDAVTAWIWLERSRGRVASRLRWCQLAANVLRALDRTPEAETALREALALRPGAPASDWEGLAELRTELGMDQPSITEARLHAAGID